MVHNKGLNATTKTREMITEDQIKQAYNTVKRMRLMPFLDDEVNAVLICLDSIRQEDIKPFIDPEKVIVSKPIMIREDFRDTKNKRDE